MFLIRKPGAYMSIDRYMDTLSIMPIESAYKEYLNKFQEKN
jgi:hypothetical protein